MTKKHFVLLAAALKAERPTITGRLANFGFMQWTLDVHAVASVCASTNPRFDRARFLAACGMEVGS